MATTRKGFNRERHTALKLVFAGLALAGFSLAWAGFAASRTPPEPDNQLLAASSAAFVTPTATRTPMATARAELPSPVATPTPTPVVDATATPAAPRSPLGTTQRRTRGS